MDLKNYTDDCFVYKPSSEVLIRDYVDHVKSISSDYKLGIPGNPSGKEVIEKTVTVVAFRISKIPVTNEFYHLVLGTTGGESEKDKPVTDVNWFETVTFCNRLSDALNLDKYYLISGQSVERNLNAQGFRLPTDAEWQLAAQAGEQQYRYGNLDDIGWYDRNSDGMKHGTALKDQNSFGLYDMLGNVWEWCWDRYDIDRYGDYRLFRGGSWASDERACGSTVRRKSSPEFKIDDLGFRLARNG